MWNILLLFTISVPTIILEESSQVCAQDLMSEMDASGIANRPFFRPLSKLPVFNAAETPVADRLARQFTVCL